MTTGHTNTARRITRTSKREFKAQLMGGRILKGSLKLKNASQTPKAVTTRLARVPRIMLVGAGLANISRMAPASVNPQSKPRPVLFWMFLHQKRRVNFGL